MQSTLASVPGALVFRALVTAILILILVSYFFSYTEELDERVAELARDRVVQELNTALSFYLYQAAASGKLDLLPSAHLQNPFELLAGKNYRIPANYRGVLAPGSQAGQPGWYFDAASKTIFYSDPEKSLPAYQLRFMYRDINGNGDFEASTDAIEGFRMVKQ